MAMKGHMTCTVTLALLTTVIVSTYGIDPELLQEIKSVTHILTPGVEKHVDDNTAFQMFCRIGDKKYMSYYFRTATLRIITSAEDIRLIKGNNPKDVYLEYKHNFKFFLWIANVLPWRARDTNFPTFNTSCVGISTSKPYTAMTIIRPIDPWKLLTFAAGVALFFMAPKLCRSTAFFYSSGTLLGGLAAALVLLFILSKFIPKGKSGYFFLSMIWTLAFYCAGESWKRMEEFIHEKLPYVILYLLSGALIAFIACYRWGPPQNPRTLDILRWSLQTLGLILIHFSSDFVELSTSFILLVVAYHNVGSFIKYYAMNYYRRWFPPQHRFLSEDEYTMQASIETKKGLEELRSFCSSPDAKPWELVARLRKPKRFSDFVKGGIHLSMEELEAYDSDDGSLPSLPAPVSPRAVMDASTCRNSSIRRDEFEIDEDDGPLLDNSLETDDDD